MLCRIATVASLCALLAMASPARAQALLVDHEINAEPITAFSNLRGEPVRLQLHVQPASGGSITVALVRYPAALDTPQGCPVPCTGERSDGLSRTTDQHVASTDVDLFVEVPGQHSLVLTATGDGGKVTLIALARADAGCLPAIAALVTGAQSGNGFLATGGAGNVRALEDDLFAVVRRAQMVLGCPIATAVVPKQ